MLLRARAIENQCFVLAAAQVGQHHDKRASYGHALAVDPWGDVLADCGGEKPGLMLVELNMEKLDSTRKHMPVQQHRRDTVFYHSLERTWLQVKAANWTEDLWLNRGLICINMRSKLQDMDLDSNVFKLLILINRWCYLQQNQNMKVVISVFVNQSVFRNHPAKLFFNLYVCCIFYV